LYTNPVLKIKNNGHISDQFKITRGIKQGCPLSSLLFIIVVEILSLRIKQNNQIKGYKIVIGEQRRELKISQYADDSTLLLHDEHQIIESLNEIQKITDVAGPKLNIKKTVGHSLGKSRQLALGECHGIKITTGQVKCLGIYVGSCIEECEHSNWHNKIEYIKELLHKWKNRNLTIFGKITLIKTLILPKLTFTATNTTVQTGIVKEVNKILFNFIWGKRDRIKRNVLVQKIEDGGIGMIDVESHFQAVKASWVGKITNSEDNWTFLPKMYLNKLGKNMASLDFICVNSSNMPCLKSLPKFYQEVIIAQSNANNVKRPLTTEDILNQPLWGNIHLMYRSGNKSRCLFSKSFINSNIVKVNSLQFINGKLDQHHLYTILQDKTNMFADTSKLISALKPYRALLRNYTPAADIKDKYLRINNKCKDYYCLYIKNKKETPRSEKILSLYIPVHEINYERVYIQKVKNIKNPKLAEFNYKVLHMILPCSENLRKWGKHDTGMCDICNASETVLHLLYDCTYAQRIWTIVGQACNIDLNKQDIFLGINFSTTDYVLSEISYLIYKEWLILRNEGKRRTREHTRSFFTRELKFKIIINNLLHNYGIVRMLSIINAKFYIDL
jgi:hypothetical protein